MKSLLRTHFIIAIISGLVCLGALVGVLRIHSSVEARKARVLEARDRLASFEQNKRVYTQEAAELGIIKARIEALEKTIVTSDSLPALLSSLESIAKANSVNFVITTVDQQAPKGAPGPVLHVDFSADGSYARLQSFVGALLSQAYQARFTKFSLYASGDGKSGQTWQLLAGMDILST